jgi:large subunit ribosomal protein L19e
MKLDKQKKLAAKVFGVGKKRIVFDNDKLSEIKEAITRADMRSLGILKAVTKNPKRSVSRVRARKLLKQKRKGRKTGLGSRKGKKTARLSGKRAWINKIRIQRSFAKELRDKKLISLPTYRLVYRRIKGGYFRSKGHIKTHLTDNRLFENVKK